MTPLVCALQKNSLRRKCFEAIDFVKITKESLYETNSLACFLAIRDTPVAATLQKNIFWWNYLCNSYKDYYKHNCSKELLCNNFGQDGRYGRPLWGERQRQTAKT